MPGSQWMRFSDLRSSTDSSFWARKITQSEFSQAARAAGLA